MKICFHGIGRVQFTLTWRERFLIVKAVLLAYLLGGCPSQHMPDELEALLCGHSPERYRSIL